MPKIFRIILETVGGFLAHGFLVIAWATLWVWPIIVIAFWGVYAGWGVWTWLPLGGYIGGTFGLAFFFNKARKTEQNTGYDDKKWPILEERAAMIKRVFTRDETE